jgi:hypothetical protein
LQEACYDEKSTIKTSSKLLIVQRSQLVSPSARKQIAAVISMFWQPLERTASNPVLQPPDSELNVRTKCIPCLRAF